MGLFIGDDLWRLSCGSDQGRMVAEADDAHRVQDGIGQAKWLLWSQRCRFDPTTAGSPSSSFRGAESANPEPTVYLAATTRVRNMSGGGGGLKPALQPLGAARIHTLACSHLSCIAAKSA
jgi:hypothetical protein